MSTATKIVVHSLAGYRPDFDVLVQNWISLGVKYVGIVGVDAARLEDIVDEFCVGDGSNPYFMLTASHPDESLADALDLANSLGDEYAGPTQVIEF